MIITPEMQMKWSQCELNAQLIQGAMDSSAKLREIETTDKTVYAQEGDEKYDKAMDYDEDGQISYDEYMKYCEENAVSQYSENPGKTVVQKVLDSNAQIQSIRPLNIGKALSAYSNVKHVPTEATVNSKA